MWISDAEISGVYLSMANSNPQVVNRWSKDLFDSLYFLIET